MNRTDKSEKWTLMKYVEDFDLMVKYAMLSRKKGAFINVDSLEAINQLMMSDGTYLPRYDEPSRDTTYFKLCQIAYYMFAYKVGQGEKQRLVFSPLGNLLLDNYDDKERVSKIFMTMLFNMPFNHPFNKMKQDFNIYPFRLVFKLLRDKRLQGRLYCDEMFYWVIWTKTITDASYERLVKNILNLRSMSPHDKYKMFKKTLPLEDTLAGALHEVVYMFGHLDGAGIATHVDLLRKDAIGTLYHGGFGRNNFIPNHMSTDELKKKKRSPRNYRTNYIQLNANVEEFADKMLAAYAFDQKPHDLLHLGHQDYITHLYNFYPDELIDTLNLRSQQQIKNMWNITNDIRQFSRNLQPGDCYRFEEVLCTAFNEFVDVTAEKIAKAGTTDIECIYLTLDEKFDLEAKSTRTKLNEVKVARLKRHRERINSQYTIVVTPYFVKGALDDINGTENVLLTANTLANFLYQAVIHESTELSYKPLYDIIQTSLGKDISPKVNQYIENTYGIGRYKNQTRR